MTSQTPPVFCFLFFPTNFDNSYFSWLVLVLFLYSADAFIVNKASARRRRGGESEARDTALSILSGKETLQLLCEKHEGPFFLHEWGVRV